MTDTPHTIGTEKVADKTLVNVTTDEAEPSKVLRNNKLDYTADDVHNLITNTINETTDNAYLLKTTDPHINNNHPKFFGVGVHNGWTYELDVFVETNDVETVEEIVKYVTNRDETLSLDALNTHEVPDLIDHVHDLGETVLDTTKHDPGQLIEHTLNGYPIKGKVLDEAVDSGKEANEFMGSLSAFTQSFPSDNYENLTHVAIRVTLNDTTND